MIIPDSGTPQAEATLDGAPPSGDWDCVSSPILRFRRAAMATEFEVLLPWGTPEAAAVASAALDQIDQVEDLLSIYRPESELSRVNLQAASRPVKVSPNLWRFLALARQVYAQTGGACDLAAGAIVSAWGFAENQPRIPAAAELECARRASGMDQVDLLPDQRAVRFRQPGLVLNPASLGKGWALDEAAARIRGRTAAALLHGGHSSLLAWGSPSGPGRGWCVGLSDPDLPTRRLGTLWLKDLAMATSAATFKHGLAHGRRFGHILDPRSGYPATGLRAATALAPSAAWADALATAFFVLGEAGTVEICQQHPAWGAILLTDNDRLPKLVGLAKSVRIDWLV